MALRTTRDPAVEEICFAEGHDWDGASSYTQGDWSCCQRCGLYAAGRQLFIDATDEGAKLSNKTVERGVVDGAVIRIWEPQEITADLGQQPASA